MRKKAFSLILLLLFSSTLLFAFQDNLAFLKESGPYSQLAQTVWNRGSLDSAEAIFSRISSSTSSDWEGLCTRLKADTLLARYCIEGPVTDKARAKSLLKDANQILASLTETADSTQKRILPAMESDILSIEYLLSPLFNVGKGLESTKIIDKAYESTPDEICVALMYANRRFYAPAIGGRNVEEAFSIFQALSLETSLSDWDQFSVLSGLGMCYKEKSMDTEAVSLLRKAQEIYFGDEAITKALSDLGEQSD